MCELGIRSRVGVHALTASGARPRRFPEICWLSKQTRDALPGPEQVECWAGIGDTPFQLTCGPWFLDALTSQLETISNYRDRILVNVGAEIESHPRAEDFARVTRTFSRVSTRDQQSYSFLVGPLRMAETRVMSAADLANISLAKLPAPAATNRSFKLGIILAADTLADHELEEVAKFILEQQGPVAFICFETRYRWDFERAVFARLVEKFGPALEQKTRLFVPDYENGSLYDLIGPVLNCEVLLSSRYHGLLAAAWGNCKVAGLERSSKITSLGEVLRAPLVKRPLKKEMLYAAANAARRISRKDLLELKAKAIEGVAFALGLYG